MASNGGAEEAATAAVAASSSSLKPATSMYSSPSPSSCSQLSFLPGKRGKGWQHGVGALR